MEVIVLNLFYSLPLARSFPSSFSLNTLFQSISFSLPSSLSVSNSLFLSLSPTLSLFLSHSLFLSLFIFCLQVNTLIRMAASFSSAEVICEGENCQSITDVTYYVKEKKKLCHDCASKGGCIGKARKGGSNLYCEEA